MICWHIHVQGVAEGVCPPQKLENFVFLKLDLWNLVNTVGYKLRAGDDEQKQFYGPD